MLDLLCPVCGGRLAREKTVWRCESRHSFDVARSGYVNLLPPSASGKRHGDDKRMVAARTAFLSRGYYDHLIGAVAGSCAQLTGPDACVLDAGAARDVYARDL
ncbi:MAG: putative RNA methyltransferase [Oscillospiraceae bacterium]